MRAAAIAAVVFAAFVGVMYLRFSGDAVPSPEPRPSPIVGADGSVCIVTRRADAPDTTPTPVISDERAPCTLSTPRTPSDPLAGFQPVPATPEPAIPDIVEGMEIVPLEIGPAIDLPLDMALIIETGCWQCDGGPGQLVRIYSRADGSVAREPLLDLTALGLPQIQYTDPNGVVREYPPFVTGYTIAPDASDVVASVCIRGTCAPDGLSSWSPDSLTVIFRSQDGGVSWTEFGRLEVGATVFGRFPDGSVLLTTYDEKEKATVRRFPDLEPLPLIPGVEYSGLAVLPNGQFIERFATGVPTWPDGRRPLIAVPPFSTTDIGEFLIGPSLEDGLATVSVYGSQVSYLVPFDNTGAIGRGSFAFGGDSVVWQTNVVRLGVDLSNGLIAGNALIESGETPPPRAGPIFEYRPVFIDLKKGMMQVVGPLADPENRFGRSHVVAVQQGPFARVVNTEGTCLYVRSDASAGASSLDCAAERVLLRRLGPERLADGALWLRVATPAGVEGWASAQYLER